jgi:predicted transposase/invertase (TIGR01784 family)
VTTSKHHPHDKLFRTVFSDKEEAEGFLRAYLPEAISSQLNWQTLTLVETSFVDEALQESESDLLYRVLHRASKTPIVLYLLFEHQSVPDKWMRFRLFKYKGRIWDESFKWHPKQEWLPPILPLTFYQGETGWTYSTQFSDLLPEIARQWPFVPQFSHVLIDQSGIGPAEVKGNLKAQIMQLLMLAAYHQPIREALAIAAQLVAQLPATGGANYLYLFVHYMVATQERTTVEAFVDAVQQHSAQIGGEMLTLAEEWLLEGEARGEARGEAKGEIKTKIETVENMLKMGVDWAFIEQVTGVDQPKFQALKRQLVQLTQARKSPTGERVTG